MSAAPLSLFFIIRDKTCLLYTSMRLLLEEGALPWVPPVPQSE